MDRLLGRAAAILTAVFSIVFVATLTTIAWPRTAPAEPVSPYRPGATIDTPAEWHESSPYTLVLFTRSSCEACQQATPFLRDLIHNIREKSAVVLVTSRAEHELDTEYANALGVDSAAVRQAVPGLRVRVTPTLVLVNRQGTILEAWEGVGPETTQAEIRAAITSRLVSLSAVRPDTP